MAKTLVVGLALALACRSERAPRDAAADGAADVSPAEAQDTGEAASAGRDAESPEAADVALPDRPAPDSSGDQGASTEAASPELNDRCANPLPIVLGNGELTVMSSTVPATDEFPALDCQGRGTAGSLSGPQLYYRFTARPEHQYKFALNPRFHAVLYVFPATQDCSVEAIQRACRSGGTIGMTSGIINPGTGQPGATVFEPGLPPLFRPQVPGDYIVTVDADYRLAAGAFTLTISEQP